MQGLVQAQPLHKEGPWILPFAVGKRWFLQQALLSWSLVFSASTQPWKRLWLLTACGEFSRTESDLQLPLTLKYESTLSLSREIGSFSCRPRHTSVARAITNETSVNSRDPEETSHGVRVLDEN